MTTWYQNATWALLRKTFVRSLIKKYRIEAVNHQPEPEEAFILLANHSHIHDPYILGGFLNQTVHYMANIEGVGWVKRKVSHLVGAFNKKKGASDFKSLRQTIELLRSGSSVGIFPEGDRSWDGKTAATLPGAAAIAKKLKVPLRIARFTGNYLSGPRWAEESRQGKILIDFYTISTEEIAKMSSEELEAKITDLISQDDIQNPLNAEVNFICKNPAAGISRILWYCPDCGGDETLSGYQDQITCNACGSTRRIDANQRIIADAQINTLSDWLKIQDAAMHNKISGAEAGPLTENLKVSICEIEGRETTEGASGKIELYTDRLVFTDSEGKQRIYEIESIEHVIDNFNLAFEFDYKKKRLRILFEGANASKWIFFIKALKEKSRSL